MQSHQFRFPRIEIKLNESAGDKAQAPEWIQVIRCGAFSDPRYGTFQITPETLRSMKANFDSKIRGVDLAMDYAHESQSVAAGWFSEVELRSDDRELWAKIKWTPNGSRVLADREFRYVSADFSFNYVDNETGKEHGPTLFGAGLTNRPVIKGMDPAVELTENKGANEMKTVEQLQAEVLKLSEDLTAAQEQAKASEAAVAETETLKAQVAELTKQNEELKASAAKAEEAKVLAERKSTFDKLLSEGKAVEAQRDAFMKQDMMKFAELSKPVKLSESGSDAGKGEAAPAAANADEAAAKILELAEAMVKAKKAASLGAAITVVLSENEELRKKYEGK
jgi:phage I-like protein